VNPILPDWEACLIALSENPASRRGTGSIVATREIAFHMTADGPRLRVVTLVDGLVQGGAECLAVEVTTRLDPEPFERALCVRRWSDPADVLYGDSIAHWREEIEQADVRLVALERRGAWDLPAWRPLLRLLRRTDVVHAHMFGSNVTGVVLGRTPRVPVVIAHEHSWSFARERGHSRLVDRHLIARGSDALVACSREDRRRTMEIGHIAACHIRYVPHGIVVGPRGLVAGADGVHGGRAAGRRDARRRSARPDRPRRARAAR
jgi:hypothetical protein